MADGTPPAKRADRPGDDDATPGVRRRTSRRGARTIEAESRKLFLLVLGFCVAGSVALGIGIVLVVRMPSGGPPLPPAPAAAADPPREPRLPGEDVTQRPSAGGIAANPLDRFVAPPPPASEVLRERPTRLAPDSPRESRAAALERALVPAQRRALKPVSDPPAEAARPRAHDGVPAPSTRPSAAAGPARRETNGADQVLPPTTAPPATPPATPPPAATTPPAATPPPAATTPPTPPTPGPN
jgi:hypothetical protein